MPCSATHQDVLTLWGKHALRLKRAESAEHALRDAMVETATVCRNVVGDHKEEARQRIGFLFVDPKHGLAGWTKEAI